LHSVEIPIPQRARAALGASAPVALRAVGNPVLLAGPLLGLLASREFPGRVLLDTLDRVPGWVRDGRVILSGFHSPLEQQVLRSLLRRQGRAVKVLARGMADYRPPPEERAPLADGTLLVLTGEPARVRRTTRERALARNRLVLALATELVVPYAAPGSGLAELLADWKATQTDSTEPPPTGRT
jgi:predicted Rossmann fold nucleotide-binding protein DprA/Smf involved in DNA uptake